MATTKSRIAAIAVAAAAIAAPAEGLRQYAYYDPVGVLTVCYGSTTDVVKGKKYSVAECKARLEGDMLKAVQQVARCHPGLPDNVWIAFSDAVYNMGPQVACGFVSKTHQYLKAGNYTAACNQLMRWNKGKIAGQLVELPGLTKRRAKERAVCLGLA